MIFGACLIRGAAFGTRFCFSFPVACSSDMRAQPHRLAQHRLHLLRRHAVRIGQVDLVVVPVGDQVVRRQELPVQPGNGRAFLRWGGRHA